MARKSSLVVQPSLQMKTEKCLVIVENEVTQGGLYDHWQDTTGVRYQFPNQYKNKIVPGRRFIYYRGTHRKNGRGIAEYFGKGVIGNVYIDPEIDLNKPKANWHWFFDVDDYVPFKQPIPAKIDNKYFEQIAKNLWSVAVREITPELYNTILDHADLLDSTPVIKNQIPEIVDNNLKASAHKNSSQPTKVYIRQSQRAKEIGDRGERIVYEYLFECGTIDKSSLKWVAAVGETPGYDIEYKDAHMNTIGVEVKSTTAKLMTGFEITANEFDAMERMKENYLLAIVTEVDSEKPKICFLKNVFYEIRKGGLEVAPISYRVVKVE